MSISDLPIVNASLNGLSAIFLGLGYWFIRQKRVEAHRSCMIAALVTSALFLGCYLTYHFKVHAVTRFTKPEWFRPVYLATLLSHTVLAAVILPLIVVTLRRALRRRFELHRKIARWTWPLWIYVSITGVVIYLLLYRIFPQQ